MSIVLRTSLPEQENYRAVKLAAKNDSNGSHWSNITRSFFLGEFCFTPLTCQGGAKKQRTYQVIVFAIVSRYHTLRMHYKPTFTNISNLHLPFLISQNACFRISHLRFAHLLEKALGLLFKTNITKKSAIFRHSFLRAIDRLIFVKRNESTRINV